MHMNPFTLYIYNFFQGRGDGMDVGGVWRGEGMSAPEPIYTVHVHIFRKNQDSLVLLAELVCVCSEDIINPFMPSGPFPSSTWTGPFPI